MRTRSVTVSVWGRLAWTAILLILPTKALRAAGGGGCIPPPSGMVAWWKGDSNALDIVSGYNGTLRNGTGFFSDFLRTAFSFDGVDDLVQVGDAPGLRFTRGMTMEAWVRPAQFQSPANEILSKWDAPSGTDHSYTFKCDSSGRIVFSLSADGIVSSIDVTSPNEIPTNQWSHVAGTYDGTTVRVYINGNLQGTGAFSSGIYPGAADLCIGSALFAPSRFSGAIDELSLYNRALSQNELLGIYFNGTSNKCTTAISPVITVQPLPQIVRAGSNVMFSTTAGGTTPLSYRWRLNGTNITGLTSNTLVLPNVKVSQVGTYTVLVSNLYNTVLSSNAPLTVFAAVTGCVNAASGLVSWWGGENNANDSSDSNSGSPTNVTFAGGEVGQAFVFNGASASIQVPDAPNLRFSTGMTFEAWIYPTVVGGQYHEIFSKWEGGVNQRSYTVTIDPSGKALLTVSPDGGFGNLANVPSQGPVPTNQWTHLATAYDGSTLKLYLNGVLQNTTPWTQGIFPGTAPLVIGSTFSSGSFFSGMIDEPSVYNRALSESEIQAIFIADGFGKCSGGGTPPFITGQPQDQTVLAGSNATFSVTANGSPVLQYQWRKGTNGISGATASSYTVLHAQTNDAGLYSVLVSNAFGFAFSSNAALAVITSSSNCVTPPSGMISWWRGEGNAVDSADSNFGVFNGGAATTNGLVGQAFNLNGSSAYVQVADAANLRFTNAMSVEAWINSKVPAGQFGAVITKWDGGFDQRSYTFAIQPSGLMALGVSSDGQDNGGVDVGTVFSAFAIPTNQWVHVCGTYDGAALKMYVNGALQNTLAWPQGIFPGSVPLSIGSALVSGAFFNGLIDEPTVYNRPLTATEVANIFSAGSAGKCPPPGVPPLITSQPTNAIIAVGSNATFRVFATGSVPLLYQWRKGTNGIIGATNTAYSVLNAQTNDAGIYSVLVSNVYGFVFSSNATLTVTVPSNSCVTAPTGMVSWWKGEGNANDSADANPGVFNGGATTTPGFVGQAFSLNGSSAYVQVSDAGNLRFTNAMSVEAWINSKVPAGQFGAVITKWDGGFNQRSYTFAIQPSGLMALGVSSDGQDNGSVDVGTVFSASAIPTNQWVHVCGTYDGVALKMYFNGSLQNTLAWPQGIFPGSVPLSIGSALVSGAFFNGLIDEPTVYNRSLTATEVASIYNAGPAGKCPVVQGTPPLITVQPTNRTVTVGSNTTFTVFATGTAPLAYQWRKATNGIGGATNSVYTIIGVQTNDAGVYSVLISNAYGFVFSSNSTLTVTVPSNSCVTPPAGIVSWWKGEGNANDSIDSNPGFPGTGVSFAAGRVGQAFNFDGTSGLVQVADAPNLRFTNAMTVEAWVYPRSVGGAYHEIVSKWEGGVDQRSYALVIDPDTIARFAVISDGVGNLGRVGTLGSIPTNQWSHLAGVYDGFALKLYLNGVLQNTNPWTQGIFAGTAPLIIGSTLLSGSFFDGLIDEPAVYNRAFTATEVANIYNAGAAGKCQVNSNHPPTVPNMSAATKQNLAMSIPNEKFLALATDPDKDPLTLASVSIVSTNGSSVIFGTNQVTYSPRTNYLGADRFTFSITDGRGATNSAFVLIQVRATNQVSGNMLPLVQIRGGYEVSFLGIPNLTYTLQRALDMSGPWTILGPVTANSIGLATFTDTNAPPGNAFYRTTYP